MSLSTPSRPSDAAASATSRPRFRLIPWLVVLALAAAAVFALERAFAPPAAAAAQEEELETFVPSEELPADSAVSFPVDI